jgi:hypothetical protein
MLIPEMQYFAVCFWIIDFSESAVAVGNSMFQYLLTRRTLTGAT